MRTYDELYTAIEHANDAYDAATLLHCADELDELSTPQATALAELARGFSFYIRRLPGDALRHFESALAIYTDLNDEAGRARALSNVGIALYVGGRESEALDAFQRSLALHDQLMNRKGIATLTTFIGIIYFGIGKYTEAIEQYTRSLAVHEELGDRAGVADALCNIGLVYENMGDYPPAMEYYHRAYREYEASGDRDGLAGVIGNIGNVQSATGDLAAAMESYQLALAIHTELGVQRGVAVVTGNIGSLYMLMGDDEQALTYLREALALNTAAGDERGAGLVTGSIITALIKQQAWDEARAMLATTEGITYENPRTVVELKLGTAKVLAHDGNVNEAMIVLRAALEIAEQHMLREEQVDIHAQLRDLSLTLNDLPGYVASNTAYMRLNEEIRGQESTRKLAMHDAQRRIEAERKEHEKHLAILHSTLPKHVADRVARGEVVNDQYDVAAVLFLDIVGFTSLSARLSPQEVITFLDVMFKHCDDICGRHGLTKIKTIGDSYMAVAFDMDSQNVCERAAAAALEMLQIRVDPPVTVRIGLHCGPVVAGVIGSERMQYDVWGDTVNVASRMESLGEPGRIHVSDTFAERLASESQTMHTIVRGAIDVKGKGMMNTYWLTEPTQPSI